MADLGSKNFQKVNENATARIEIHAPVFGQNFEKRTIVAVCATVVTTTQPTSLQPRYTVGKIECLEKPNWIGYKSFTMKKISNDTCF